MLTVYCNRFFLNVTHASTEEVDEAQTLTGVHGTLCHVGHGIIAASEYRGRFGLTRRMTNSSIQGAVYIPPGLFERDFKPFWQHSET